MPLSLELWESFNYGLCVSATDTVLLPYVFLAWYLSYSIDYLDDDRPAATFGQFEEAFIFIPTTVF